MPLPVVRSPLGLPLGDRGLLPLPDALPGVGAGVVAGGPYTVLVWCGVVWCGVVWCGVVWCGVVWCGVVWCGVVCRRRCYQKAKAGMSTQGYR